MADAVLIIHNNIEDGTLARYLIPANLFGLDLPSLESMDTIDSIYQGEPVDEDKAQLVKDWYTDDEMISIWQDVDRMTGPTIPPGTTIVRVYNFGYVW